jgi:phage terminase large subunit
MTLAKVKTPPKLIPVFTPKRGSLRYRGARGGRGSGKSFNFAKMAAIWGVIEPLRILCTREFQGSIKESFHAELKNAIASEPWLEKAYDVGVDYLRSNINGTEFIFRGLRHNIGSIKSLAQIDLCIIEEAEDVPEHSWVALEPTIRAPGSEIWVLWNPKIEGSPVDSRFVQNTPPRSMIVEMNHTDNPWFPVELEEQRLHAMATMPPEVYAHIWEGAYLTHTDAQVFKGKWRVAEFETPAAGDGPYYGVDFGFAQDPTTGLRCWVVANTLMIDYDGGQVGLELDKTAPYLIEQIPGIADHASRADSARPESINYLSRHGLRKMVGVDKWKGSVEDGIEFIRSFDEVLIHPRCKQTAREFALYSYKQDRLSGDILPAVVDANNHYIDALRYALGPMIKAKRKPVGHAPIRFAG